MYPTVFDDQQWHWAQSDTLQEYFPGFTNLVEVSRDEEVLYTLLVSVPTELFKFLQDSRFCKPEGAYQMCLDYESSAEIWIFSIALDSAAGPDFIDLWKYPENGLPGWLENPD